MKNYLWRSIIKFFLYILYILPLRLSIAIGEFLGVIAWLVSSKQRRIALKNLKIAFSHKKNIKQLNQIVLSLYKHLGMSVAEIARFKKLDESHIDKYIDIEGLDDIVRLKNEGKGVIFLTAHYGNWELSSQAASIKGYPMKVLARRQKKSFIDEILNRHRNQNGCEVVTKGANLRVALRTLKDKKNLGMLADEDVKEGGVFVDFFGRHVSAPKGPALIASRTDTPLIFSFFKRIKGPYHKLILNKPFYVDGENSITASIQTYHNKLATVIEDCPWQWLWIQKRWRSAKERNITVLSDKKAGHLNQSLAVANYLKDSLSKKGFDVASACNNDKGIDVAVPEFKNRFTSFLLYLAVKCRLYKLFPELLLKLTLRPKSFNQIISLPVDYLISAGNSLCALNVVIKHLNLAKNIVVMKPAVNINNYDLAIIPKHDNPPKHKNVILTQGSLSLVGSKLKQIDKDTVRKKYGLEQQTLGIFFGGDTKFYKYSNIFVSNFVKKAREISLKHNLDIVITTSRRSTRAYEEIIKQELNGYSKCKSLVIANESNPPDTALNMMAVSGLIIVTADSISMVCEAASSQSPVIVIVPADMQKKSGFKKHKKLIDNLNKKGYIHLATLNNLESLTSKVLSQHKEISVLNEEPLIRKGLEDIL
jgi:KDO2-lipid IV(A) lauroyltransferase